MEGFLDAQNEDIKEEFRKDCHIFSVASGKIHEILHGYPSEVWRKTIKFWENKYDEAIEKIFLNSVKENLQEQ